MKKQSVISALALSVLPVAAVAALSALLTDSKGSWYLSLRKPSFTPPDWAFPLAWGIVYLCAIAAIYLLLRRNEAISPTIVSLLCAVGVLNVLWLAVFFHLHAPSAACAVLLALLCALVWLICLLRPANRASMFLLLPHLLWGSFALALNVGIALLNAA